MTTVLYEHPLNERIRNYLKIEQLLAQADDSLTCNLTVSHQVYFNALFTMLDMLERNDIRGDLIKELEKLEQSLVLWSKSPEIDNSVLQENLRRTVELISQLRTSAPNWLVLKDNKFLAGLKQRFAIQGGSSTFDLPQLQYWLSQPDDQQKKDAISWLAELNQIRDALVLILKFIRQRAAFSATTAPNGFFQDSGEGIVLLRMQLPANANYFPTVSGNKFRYSIRFMLPCEAQGKRFTSEDVNFELARC